MHYRGSLRAPRCLVTKPWLKVRRIRLWCRPLGLHIKASQPLESHAPHQDLWDYAAMLHRHQEASQWTRMPGSEGLPSARNVLSRPAGIKCCLAHFSKLQNHTSGAALLAAYFPLGFKRCLQPHYEKELLLRGYFFTARDLIKEIKGLGI